MAHGVPTYLTKPLLDKLFLKSRRLNQINDNKSRFDNFLSWKNVNKYHIESIKPFFLSLQKIVILSKNFKRLDARFENGTKPI